MSRWTVNPIQLVRNVRLANRIGPGWVDRANYLRWIYNDKGFGRADRRRRRLIRFRLPAPVGDITLCLRDNQGSDQLVFGEVLIKLDYRADIPEPETVLDLGGNIGLATLYFARRWPNARLAVAEPIPSNLEILRENLALNQVDATIFPAAVGTDDGPVTMILNELDCAHRIGEPGMTGDRVTAQVDAISIPTMMSRLGWERIGFLKLDIEGYEAQLLRHNPTWLERTDSVCIESFDGTLSDGELSQIASRFGFTDVKQPSGLHLWTRSR